MQPLLRRHEFAAAACATFAAVVAYEAHFRWPYHTYDTFRWLIALAAIATAYLLRTRPIALTACVVIAVLFNPIAPLRMRAYQWQRYDTLAMVVMATVAVYAFSLARSLGVRR